MTFPLTFTISLLQDASIPRLMHSTHGIFLSHFTLLFAHVVQLRGARWVARTELCKDCGEDMIDAARAIRVGDGERFVSGEALIWNFRGWLR